MEKEKKHDIRQNMHSHVNTETFLNKRDTPPQRGGSIIAITSPSIGYPFPA